MGGGTEASGLHMGPGGGGAEDRGQELQQVGRRRGSPEVAAFHLGGGVGKDQQEAAATSTNPPRSAGGSESHPLWLGQAP